MARKQAPTKKPQTLWTDDMVRVMRSLRLRLAQAEKCEDWRAVIAIVNDTVMYFEQRGQPLPDNWKQIELTRADAEAALRRLEAGV